MAPQGRKLRRQPHSSQDRTAQSWGYSAPPDSRIPSSPYWGCRIILFPGNALSKWLQAAPKRAPPCILFPPLCFNIQTHSIVSDQSPKADLPFKEKPRIYFESWYHRIIRISTLSIQGPLLCAGTKHRWWHTWTLTVGNSLFFTSREGYLHTTSDKSKIKKKVGMGPPKLLFHMNGWSWLMLHNFLKPLKQATASLGEPQPPIPLAKWPQTWH